MPTKDSTGCGEPVTLGARVQGAVFADRRLSITIEEADAAEERLAALIADASNAVERLALNADEAAQALGISVRHVRDLIATGTVPSARLGHRVVIPVAALQRALDEATESTDSESLGSRAGAHRRTRNRPTEDTTR